MLVAVQVRQYARCLGPVPLPPPLSLRCLPAPLPSACHVCLDAPLTSGCTQINGQDLDALLPLSLSSLGMGLWFCFWLDAWRVKDDALRVRTVSLLQSGCGKTGQARRLNSSPSGNVRLQQSEGGRQKQSRQRHKQSREWGSSSPGTSTAQEQLGAPGQEAWRCGRHAKWRKQRHKRN